jgi:hypothetical protein
MCSVTQNAGMNVPAAFVGGLAGVTGGVGVVGAHSHGPPAVPHIGGTPSTCIKIKNMFNPEEEKEENWDMDIKV